MLVVEDGRIVEDGPPDRLIAAAGRFAAPAAGLARQHRLTDVIPGCPWSGEYTKRVSFPKCDGYSAPAPQQVSYAPIVSYGEDGSDGTRAVPSYITAEAETVPIPKIVASPPRPPAPPPRESLWQRLGDLPMRVIYRFAAGAAAVIVLAGGGVTYWVTRDDESPSSTVAAPGTTPTTTATAASAVASADATPAPSASPDGSPATAPATVEPASADTGSPAATPEPTATPGRTRRTSA